jgi:hypothetical protein
MLTERRDWMPLGNADEQKVAKPDARNNRMHAV